MIITDPYRPPVADMTPKDHPFVVESHEELPAARQELSYVTCRKT